MLQTQYKTILLDYLDEGGELTLELAYELGRQAIAQGTSVLNVVDTHYEILNETLSAAKNSQECVTIAQRATSLLKEVLGPFEMTQRGYSETIALLRNQNEKLMKLIEERSQLLQQRENLMMVITHDLKTPITAADRCLSLMLDGDFGDLSSSQLELLSTMKDSNQRMFTMVKNLLEVYKYDHSTPILNFKKLDLQAFINSTVKAFSLSAQLRDLQLNTEALEKVNLVLADETAIQHVLANLIDNAIKFTPRGGVIQLSSCDTASQVIVSIHDTGRGIAPEDMPKLFQRIFQSESGYKQQTGTGLGLYLCQQIMKAHQGNIHCQSELGAGTTFILTFPACKGDNNI